jgi:hypothetical protein
MVATGGRTNFGPAFATALQVMREAPASFSPYFVFLSNGNNADADAGYDALRAMYTEFGPRGLQALSVAYGTDASEAKLTEVARTCAGPDGRGRFSRVMDAAGVESQFHLAVR